MTDGIAPRSVPIVDQLRFARAEYRRGLDGLDPALAVVRVGRLNPIGWSVGHLAWQEQRYFLTTAQGVTLRPELAIDFASGAPMSAPDLGEVLAAWHQVTEATDGWLRGLTLEDLQAHPQVQGRLALRTYGSLLLRTIYHYWFHNGENLAIRQMLEGAATLPEFVGALDDEAPYRPEALK